MNKKGWIKIVEAFVAVMIIMAVLLIVINNVYLTNSDASDKIYQAETSILYSIVSDDVLKKGILDEPAINIKEDGNSITTDALAKINEMIPDYLSCKPRICELTWDCKFIDSEGISEKNIYSQSVVVRDSANPATGRQLKIFCWVK